MTVQSDSTTDLTTEADLKPAPMLWAQFDDRLVRVLEDSFDIVTNGNSNPLVWEELMYQVSAYMPSVGYQPYEEYDNIPCSRSMREHLKRYIEAGMPWNGIPKASAPSKKCSHGHLWTVENTYVRPNGSKVCRDCKNEKRRRR